MSAQKSWRRVVACVLGALALGCNQFVAPGGDGPPPDVEPDGYEYEPRPDVPYELVSAQGKVLEFGTGDEVTDPVAITTYGLNPAPPVIVVSPDFVVQNVPLYSTFHILIDSAPYYRRTHGAALEVEDQPLREQRPRIVRADYVEELAAAFGVEPYPDRAIVIGRAYRATGEPYAGVSYDTLAVRDAPDARGPYFLRDDYSAYPDATETQAGGWFVFFDVPAGETAYLEAKPGADYTVTGSGPTSPYGVTLIDAVVTAGGDPVVPPGPVDVSFTTDVLPIFSERGCTAECHTGGGQGAQLGGLILDGTPDEVHYELTEETSPNTGTYRVDTARPDYSLVLTRPLLEDPPDVHPNTTFLNPYDPDFVTIRSWIEAGAYLD